jgi:DNA-binding PadR family transcriptional regulator
VYRITPGGQAALREWLLDPDTTYEIRDEGLLRLFFSDLLAPEEVVDLVRRRRTWFELTAAYFREIGGELDARDDDVLRYGIELMEWNAAWFARLEERLTQD